jgi:hypothetical protein
MTEGLLPLIATNPVPNPDDDKTHVGVTMTRSSTGGHHHVDIHQPQLE